MSTDSTDTRDGGQDRRAFLKLAAAAPAAAAAVAATGAQAAQAPDVVAQGRGYRETDHVLSYLDSARF